MQRLIRPLLQRTIERSPRVRAMLAGMLGRHLSTLDLSFLRALPDGVVVDLDGQFELEKREPGMPSVLWSMLWEASAARRYEAPLLKRVEFRLRGRRFVMELDLAQSPECGYLLRNPTIRITAQLLAGGATMLDVGANAGFHALAAALFYNDVVAFEPTPATAARLERNVALSQLANVRVEHVALSNRDGEASFELNPAHCGANRLGGGASSIKVPLKRLDSMLDALRSVDLIKIDVEGHECEVIEGARALLERDKPTLIVEFNQPSQFERLRGFLPQGYRAVGVGSGAEAVAVRDVTFTAR